MKPSQSPSLEPPLICAKSPSNATVNNRSNTRPYHIDRTDASLFSNNSMTDLLTEIRDLLKTRVQNEAEQRSEEAKENEMKHDWMLAAAVLDRIFSIIFTIVFAGGTLAFIMIFAVNIRVCNSGN